jgi:hypothetical protein
LSGLNGDFGRHFFNLEKSVEREKDVYEIDVHGEIKNTEAT